MGIPFVEEIDYKEIEFPSENEVVGKGSFGTVKRGWWTREQQPVAVKIIETEQEKQAFFIELKQLSRVNHPNIVKLYGACTQSPVCLVMEYAEGGSLYNVLHCMKDVAYTAGHAMSWALQCAIGVAYLHNMKPRPLIHRDLKPQNLLLVNGGTILKICDFGTACDYQTFMTNVKGSAAWMAPEVFEGRIYNERCDIYSWAIILWEILTREKPYYGIPGANACGIMWAVYSGKRPPLIKGCPKPIENLMTKCWTKEPKKRFSMMQVIDEIKKVFKYFKGTDVPILNIQATDVAGAELLVPQYPTPTETRTSGYQSISEQNNNKEERLWNDDVRSPEAISTDEVSKENKKRHSADFSNCDIKLPSQLGHRRTGSCDSPWLKVQTSSNEISQLPPTTDRRDDREPYRNDYGILEPQLQPLQPVQSCPESVELYEEHCRMAEELLQLQADINTTRNKKSRLQQELQRRSDSRNYIEDYLQLKKENDNLLLFRENLKEQLEKISSHQEQNGMNHNTPNQNAQNSPDDWVVVTKFS